MDDRLQRAPVGVVDVSPAGTVEGVNDAARELLDDGDAVGAPIEDAVPRSVEDSLLDAFEADAVPDTEFEEYYPTLERWLAVTVRSRDGGATVYLRDVTERRRSEQAVDRLRGERDRTALIDDVRSEVLAELVDASSREEIAETICRGLGETDLYEFAWVGEREVGSDDLVVRAAAGRTGETFAAVDEAVTDGATTPEERAIETGRVQTAQPLADAPGVPDAVRMAGFADGVQSLLAIPLAYGSTVHGVVGVYASANDAFSERERRSFETLGEIAGFAVRAARNRSLLLSDGVTEVTFDVGRDSTLGAVSAELDTAVALDGVVPRGDDALLCYVAVDDADLADVPDAVSAVEGVGDVRVVTTADAGGTVEVELRGDAPLLAVASLGGTVRRAEFEDGSGRIVVDLPPEEDARRIADAVTRDYDASVVAKRDRERSVTTAREVRDELGESLTDRQEAVLRTAYLADYFESPRGSTAEEVAASLDITGSTLLHHLRAGQRKLLDAFFDDHPDP